MRYYRIRRAFISGTLLFFAIIAASMMGISFVKREIGLCFGWSIVTFAFVFAASLYMSHKPKRKKKR